MDFQNLYALVVSRPSHVRNAVLAQLNTGTRHSWTVDEMLAELRSQNVSADFSSVFRGLTWCEAAELVRRIDLGDSRLRFERVGSHHEHARCESCGTVTAVPGCLVEGAARQLADATGFAVNGHSLVFTGLCRACQS